MSKIKKILSVILTLVFTGLFLMGASYVTRDKSGDAKVADFYDDPSLYDVYILGSSHALMGLLPLEMWEAEGITSYNLANYGQAIPVDYWVMRNAVKQHKPEVVLIDVYTVFFDEKYSHFHMGYLHQSLDTMPMSKLKLDALEDLLDDGENHLEMYMPFSFYHSRWDSLTTDDLKPVEHEVQFGADVDQRIAGYRNGIDPESADRITFPFGDYDLLPEDEKATPPDVSTEYVRKMIEFCQSEEIEVVLTSCPMYLTEDKQRYLNSIADLADEYGVPFINGVMTDVVDYRTDMFDSGHLNSSGARKWSRYMAEFLVNEFGLTDHRGDSDFDIFDENSEAQREADNEYLSHNKSLYGCLVMASDPQYRVCIAIAEGSSAFEDDEIRLLINNIDGLDVTAEEWDYREGLIVDNGVDCDVSSSDADIIIEVYDLNGQAVTECLFVGDYNGIDGFTRIIEK